ncbi:YchJ family protein [Microbacterium hydrocarbonoxydans]|uniref:YchJ family protein n=1 Tax=Microbacterium hydrocarbonoxydans TaxID=273678 RepID=UPI0007BC814B|nr:YchJ family metal-binding protein [Microbacterium hydrocarbonoxydans]GAT73284.1 sec-C motif domain-containing protein [Microbacterium sp. HM58-2]
MDDSRCPCGSGDLFDGCCGPLLAGAAAPTAERLMRSRYTAFARHDAAHLLASWHPSSRPRTIGFEPDLEWRRLIILGRSAGGPFDRDGVVEFEAFWRQGAERGSLRERSRFVREDRRWLYVDGEIG